MDDETHRDDHAWVRAKRSRESKWLEQWDRIIWTVLSTVVIGGVMTLFAVLWWAVQRFVERGGA